MKPTKDEHWQVCQWLCTIGGAQGQWWTAEGPTDLALNRSARLRADTAHTSTAVGVLAAWEFWHRGSTGLRVSQLLEDGDSRLIEAVGRLMVAWHVKHVDAIKIWLRSYDPVHNVTSGEYYAQGPRT